MKTTSPWVKSPRWLSVEKETVVNITDRIYTYFALDRTNTPALDMRGNSTKVNVRWKDKMLEVEVYRAGHCAICHSTTHSKHGCLWDQYAKKLEIAYWYKDR